MTVEQDEFVKATIILEKGEGRHIYSIPECKGVTTETRYFPPVLQAPYVLQNGAIAGLIFEFLEPQPDSEGHTHKMVRKIHEPEQDQINLILLALDGVETDALVTVQHQQDVAFELHEELKRLGLKIVRDNA